MKVYKEEGSYPKYADREELMREPRSRQTQGQRKTPLGYANLFIFLGIQP